MIPFHSRFPDLAASETRCLHVLNPGGPLPMGEYGYLEHYCDEPDCDCRRVLLCVTTAGAPHTVLATINYGWESAEFYTRWMHRPSLRRPARVSLRLVQKHSTTWHPQSTFIPITNHDHRRHSPPTPTRP